MILSSSGVFWKSNNCCILKIHPNGSLPSNLEISSLTWLRWLNGALEVTGLWLTSRRRRWSRIESTFPERSEYLSESKA